MILKLIFKEIMHRKLNFLLSFLAIVMAVAFFVSFFTTGAASKRETIRLTRDLGFNLRIIPKETNMDQFWTSGFSDYTMPEEYINRFLAHKDLSYAHLTATLQKKVTWRNKEVILTGISSEIEPSGKQKAPMIFTITPGNIYVGFELARSFGIVDNDSIEFLGRSFKVTKCLQETGSDDDIRVYGQLADIQSLLHLEGRINEIRALHCLCLRSDNEDPLPILRQQLSQVLPEAKVILNKTIAMARERQRMMLDNYFAFIMPLVIIVCAVWIGVLALLNVRERLVEIGIMRALGYGSGKIAALFLGKALVIGLVGAALGFVIGTSLALSFGPGIFKVTAQTIKPVYGLLALALGVAPIFTALAAFIPAMSAVAQDPAVTLREA